MRQAPLQQPTMKDRLLGLEAKEKLLSHTNKTSQAAFQERTREIQNRDTKFSFNIFSFHLGGKNFPICN